MSAAAPPSPVPGPGAAGWILAIGAALSLHVAALALLVLVLAAPPQAPAAAQGGIVIRNIAPVTASAPRTGRARAETVEARRADTAPQARLAALDDSAPRHAATAPRRIAAITQSKSVVREDASRRVAPAEQDRPEVEAHAPRRIAAITQSRSVVRQGSPRRSAPEPPATGRALPPARRLSAGGARAVTADGAQPTTLEGIAPAPRSAREPALQTAPLRAPETRAGLAPERTRPATAPTPPKPAPRRSRARRAGPDQRLTDRQAAPARDPDTVSLEQMRTVLADLHGAPCHAVLPLPEGMSGFAAIGTDPARLGAAGPRLDRAFGRDTRPVLATHMVTDAQCAAVDFVAASRDDPRRGLGLDLWRTAVGEGQPLTGTLLHGATGALYLLLIDGAGQVHDLTGFLRLVPDGSQFSVPMSGAGAPGGARELLLAIATPTPLQILPPRQTPTAAAPLFTALAQELQQLGLVPDLALAAFVFE